MYLSRRPWKELLSKVLGVPAALAAAAALAAPQLPAQTANQQGQPPAVPVHREVVVVTGTFEPVPLQESDRSVDRVDFPADQQLLGNSIADYLQLLPWLDLRQRAPDNIQGDLSIRGGTFGQTLILLDGFRLNDVQTGHHNLDLPVPMESLERIEVLRGSGSAYYGSDAVGGAVNFITRAPEHQEIRLRAGAGNFGRNQQRGSIGLLGKGWSQQWSFARNFSSGFRENRDYRHLGLASRTQLQTPWGDTRLLVAHSDRPFGADRFYGNFNSWERTRGWFAALHQSLGERTSLGVAFRRHTDLFVLYRDRPQVYTNRHLVKSYQVVFRRFEPLGQNTRLHYGAEGLWDAIDSTNLGRHDRGREAAFVALDARAFGRASWTLALRQELHRSADAQWSPTAGLGLWFTSWLRARASLSRSFRLPSYTDLYYHDPANRGSPDLLPESAWDYEAGLEWLGGSWARGELAFFERRERNGIDYIRRSPNDIWRATNILRLRFRGLEAGASFQARSHRVDVRYSLLRGYHPTLAGVVSRYVFNYPRHSGVVAWQARLAQQWGVRSRLGALKRLGRDPYALWDLYLGRLQGRWRPYFQVTNLLNTRYEEILGVAMPGRGMLGGVEFCLASHAR